MPTCLLSIHTVVHDTRDLRTAATHLRTQPAQRSRAEEKGHRCNDYHFPPLGVSKAFLKTDESPNECGREAKFSEVSSGLCSTGPFPALPLQQQVPTFSDRASQLLFSFPYLFFPPWFLPVSGKI